jgi:hypothetical protein
MNRGQRLLIAQRPGPKIGPPPDWLSPEEVQAWHEIVAACPDVLRSMDALCIALCARMLCSWRVLRAANVEYETRSETLSIVRTQYRMLGDCFIRMRERRRLLFPDRVKSK